MTLGYPISVTHPLQIDDNFRGLDRPTIMSKIHAHMPFIIDLEQHFVRAFVESSQLILAHPVMTSCKNSSLN